MTAIHKPLSTYDIAKAIHANSLDSGSVCTSPLISPWAKFKPVRRGVPRELTPQERAAAQYGMKPPTTMSATAPYYLLPYYDGDMNGWQYLLPRGKGGGEYGDDEWYRLLDFDGYEHNPENPVRNYQPAPYVILDSHPSTKFQVASFTGGVDQEGASIELNDIATILNVGQYGLYFGVALFKGTGLTPETAMAASTVIATAGAPISKGDRGVYTGTVVDITAPASMVTSRDKGTWTVVPFLCSGEIPQSGVWTPGSSFISKVFYTIPYASISEIDVQSYMDSYTITFSGYKSLAISGTVTLRNNLSEPKTLRLSAFYWDSAVGGNPLTRSRLSYEKQFDKTITIPGKVNNTPGEYQWILPSSDDSQLLITGEAYILVEGEGTVRGPFSFFKPKDV